MKKVLAVLALSLISTLAYADTSGGVLTDADIPALKDALKKAYTSEQCQKDLPNASEETCDCLRGAMADNLDVAKLKQCTKEGYDECVATEFTAAKSSLTENQINSCKALTKSDASENKKADEDSSNEEEQQ